MLGAQHTRAPTGGAQVREPIAFLEGGQHKAIPARDLASFSVREPYSGGVVPALATCRGEQPSRYVGGIHNRPRHRRTGFVVLKDSPSDYVGVSSESSAAIRAFSGAPDNGASLT